MYKLHQFKLCRCLLEKFLKLRPIKEKPSSWQKYASFSAFMLHSTVLASTSSAMNIYSARVHTEQRGSGFVFWSGRALRIQTVLPVFSNC